MSEQTQSVHHGKLFVTTNLVSSAKKREASGFLHDLTHKIANYIGNFLDEYKYDCPILYGENSFSSTFAASLSEITKIHQSETWVLRERRAQKKEVVKSGGKVDFWCKHKDVDYFFENKVSFLNTYTSTPSCTDIHKKWNVGVDQINSISDGSITWSENSCFTTFMPIVFRHNQMKKPNHNFNEDKIMGLKRRALAACSPEKPNWHALFVLNPARRNIGEDDAGYAHMPAILFVARSVFEPSKSGK